MKRMLFFLLLALLLCTRGALAQSGGDYDLEWWLLDNGGLTNASGGDTSSFIRWGRIRRPG